MSIRTEESVSEVGTSVWWEPGSSTQKKSAGLITNISVEYFKMTIIWITSGIEIQLSEFCI